MRNGWLALLVLVSSWGASGCRVAAPQDDQEFPPLDDLPFREFSDLDSWEEASRPRSYLEARIDDLLEAVSLRLILGPGLGVRASATKFVQAGLLYQGPSESFGEILHFDTLHLGNSGSQVGIWDVRSSEYGLSRWYSYTEDVYGLLDPSLPWSGGYEERPESSFEAAVHAGLIGGVVSFDPLGFARFVGGVLGFGEAGWFAQDEEGPFEADSLESRGVGGFPERR